jgi:hypothetical protein
MVNFILCLICFARCKLKNNSTGPGSLPGPKNKTMKNLLFSLSVFASPLAAQEFIDVNIYASGSGRSFDIGLSYKMPIIDTWNFTLTTGAGAALVVPFSLPYPVKIEDPTSQIFASAGAYFGPVSFNLAAGNVFAAELKTTIWPVRLGIGYQNLYGWDPVFNEYKASAEIIFSARKYNGGCYSPSWGSIFALSSFYTSRGVLGFGLNIYHSTGHH